MTHTHTPELAEALETAAELRTLTRDIHVSNAPTPD